MATTKNTSFRVHVQESDLEQVNSVNVEQGAMLVTNEALYMGFNDEMVKVYPAQSSGLGLGWARYDDTQYTSASSYAFTTATEFTVPNNAGTVLNTYINSSTAYYYYSI